jgi:hypothetical protein
VGQSLVRPDAHPAEFYLRQEAAVLSLQKEGVIGLTPWPGPEKGAPSTLEAIVVRGPVRSWQRSTLIATSSRKGSRARSRHFGGNLP